MINELFETLAQAMNPANNKTMPLAAIWLEKPLQTSKEKTVRITEGHFVHVDKEGKLQDCTKETPATHRITGCYGKIGDTDLHFSAINLKSLELIKIKIN